MRYYHSDNGDWTGCTAPANGSGNPMYHVARKTMPNGDELDYYFALGSMYRYGYGVWEVLMGVEWDGEYSDDEEKA